MRIALVCHADHRVGGGHLVRCMALAEAAVARGHQVALVGDTEAHPLSRVLRIGCGVLQTSRNDSAIRDALTGFEPQLVHLDTYDVPALGGRWPLSAMRDGQFGAAEADLLIDPTPGARPHPTESGQSVAGAAWAPIRGSVRARRATRSVKEVRRILLTLGSTDPFGLTPTLLDTINRSGFDGEVTSLGAPFDSEGRWANISLVCARPRADFAGLAAEHDLVVSASGTTVLELACMGLPMALVSVTENQQPAYQFMTANGAALGLADLSSLDAISDTGLRALLHDTSLLRRMAARAATLVDGLGADRIVSAWERLGRALA